jgi:hypothetical protein
MNNQESIDRTTMQTLIAAGASALAITALVASALAISSHQAMAKPEFAQKTGLPCGQCHTNPAGSGKLKSFGEKFKANGFKVK